MSTHERRRSSHLLLHSLVVITLLILPTLLLLDGGGRALGFGSAPPILEFTPLGPFTPKGFYSVEKRLIYEQSEDSPSMYEFTMLQGTSANVTFTLARTEYASQNPIRVNLSLANYEMGEKNPPKMQGITFTFTPNPVVLDKKDSRVNVTVTLNVSKDAPDKLYIMLLQAQGPEFTVGGADFWLRVGADHPRRDLDLAYTYNGATGKTPPLVLKLQPGQQDKVGVRITSLMNETTNKATNISLTVLDEETWKTADIPEVTINYTLDKTLLRPREQTEGPINIQEAPNAKPSNHTVLLLVKSDYYQIAQPIHLTVQQQVGLVVPNNGTTTTSSLTQQQQQKRNYVSPDAVDVCVGSCRLFSANIQYLSSVVLINATSPLRSLDVTIDGAFVSHDSNSYEPYPMIVRYRAVIPPQVHLTPGSAVNVTFTATFANGETYSASKLATVRFQSNSSTTTINNTTSSITTTTTTTATTSLATITSTERTVDASTYAWAVSATVATIVLAAILLLQRRRTK